MTPSKIEAHKQARMTNLQGAHVFTASFDKPANITAEHREGA